MLPGVFIEVSGIETSQILIVFMNFEVKVTEANPRVPDSEIKFILRLVDVIPQSGFTIKPYGFSYRLHS